MMPVFEQTIRNKYGSADHYETPGAGGRKARRNPGLYFYGRLALGPVRWLFRKAAKGLCDDAAWVHGSSWVADILEDTGNRIEIDGLSAIDKGGEACVFIANHMSTLETFLLPGIIRPRRPVTFVVKNSLVTMPGFGPVMRSRDPIVVMRRNPREDLVKVLEGGVERLKNGISIVVFPQSTRSMYFSEEHFNSIGVKLARKANVPAVPLALKTDAWGQGKRIKELGRVRPDLPTRFKFGEPLAITGTGKGEHAEICRFIETNLAAWQKQDGMNI